MRRRFVLLIGAMKSGTTALFRWLAQHPEIAASRDKEPAALCVSDLNSLDVAAWLGQWDWRPGRSRLALEASTAYAKLPVRPSAALPALRLERRLDAEFRFLYMVRHPIDRLRSEYLHSLAEGWIEKPVHEELSPRAVLFSNYHLQISPYVATHGRERICVRSYEAFRREPLAVVRSICGFLGIDPSFPFRDPGPQNSSDVHRAKLRARLARERGLPPGRLDPARSAELDAGIERSITPTPEQVARIHELLDRDLERFRDDWGIYVWNAPRASIPAQQQHLRAEAGAEGQDEAVLTVRRRRAPQVLVEDEQHGG
jgi:hypothetical protein